MGMAEAAAQRAADLEQQVAWDGRDDGAPSCRRWMSLVSAVLSTRLIEPKMQ